jgi:putative ABC transport system permease protein
VSNPLIFKKINYTMLQNYFAIAIRNMRRHPFFSGINIAGLGVGLAACWLISLYVLHERSFDSFLPEADRICAVALNLKMQQTEGRTTNTPPPLGPRLLADFPEIEMAARTFYLRESVVRRDLPLQAPLAFNEEGVYAADTSFLELFGFPMVEGDPRTALDRPGSLVLSEDAAGRFFGKNSPMGQMLLVNDRPFTVTGVVKNLPPNSTVQFDFLVPIADYRVVERFSWSWIWLQVDTWVRLRQTPDAAGLAALESKFPAMVRRHAPAAFERVGQNFEEQIRNGDRYDIHLLPLKTLHLGQKALDSRIPTLADGGQVRMFGIVGLLILLLACVNFMNLSTARSSLRAREVGVRKALGSPRRALVGQFLAESLLYSAAGMGLAAVLAAVALPVFNRLTGLDFSTSALFAPQNLALAVGLTLLTGLLGGLYPAFFLSKFSSSEIFKSSANASAKGGHAGVRSGLVVLQLSVSIALLLGAWAVLRQLDFARKNSPGLQRENVLVLPVLRNLVTQADEASKIESFRQQIEQLPEVESASASMFLPSVGSFGDFYEPEQGDQSQSVPQNLPISSFMADAHFTKTLGLEIREGRNFQDDHGRADSNSVLLNEAAVRAIGWEKPLGKWLRYPGNGNQRFQVVGVLRDFHLGSVRGPIEPAAIFHRSSKTYRAWANYLTARLRPGTEQAALAKIAPIWATTMPNAPFKYDFLDASFARMYRSEAQTSSILSLFTGLAMFIACLGLFALAAFMAERRTKEIGIRKVLGASVAGITGLLAKDFLKLVLIAIVIASPVAYYFMQKWLSDFAYRIDIQWWMFAGAGLAAVAIAFLTVGFQSVRAALTNPVKSLRSE